MGMTTENSAHRNVTACPDESLMQKYQNEMRKICLLKALASQLEKIGVLTPAERREFLVMEAEKYALDQTLLTR